MADSRVNIHPKAEQSHRASPMATQLADLQSQSPAKPQQFRVAKSLTVIADHREVDTKHPYLQSRVPVISDHTL